jgi:hypothetical protein
MMNGVKALRNRFGCSACSVKIVGNASYSPTEAHRVMMFQSGFGRKVKVALNG